MYGTNDVVEVEVRVARERNVHEKGGADRKALAGRLRRALARRQPLVDFPEELLIKRNLQCTIIQYCLYE